MASSEAKKETTVAPAEQHQAEMNNEPAGAMNTTINQDTEAADSSIPWREWVDTVLEFLTFPDYVGKFFADYRQPIIVLALLISSLIAVKVTLAILSALNEVPLLAPFFEIIGIGYTGWFVYRYLLKASSRKELSQEFTAWKSQVAGEKSTGS